MTKTIQKLWAAGDGSGGYDIGQGDFTLATVRNLREQDGAKVHRAYEETFKQTHDPRTMALLFKAAPDMLAALRCALADLEGIMPEFETSGDRQHPAWQTITEIREAIAKATGQ